MLYIYKFTNKLNGKVYIGQTNNIIKRKNGHKSTALNSKSNDYNLPFHNAIRKYGWESFSFEILEEIDDSFGREYLNEREKFFIKKEHSLLSENGYNLTTGGDGCPKIKLTFEECVARSKIFTLEEVLDIQKMLIEGYAFFEILNKYPKLTKSFLSNINTGLNFVNPELSYPLSTTHSHYSKETKEKIIQAIKSGETYKDITTKYGISAGFISMINSGKKWYNEKETYPLKLKSCSNGKYSHEVKKDLIFNNLTHEQIGLKYNKAKSTITAINTGRNRKDNRFIYPLDKHKEKNQKIWNTLF